MRPDTRHEPHPGYVAPHSATSAQQPALHQQYAVGPHTAGHHAVGPYPTTHTFPTDHELRRPLTVTIGCVLFWLISAVLTALGVITIVQARAIPAGGWNQLIPFMGELIIVLMILVGVTLLCFALALALLTLGTFRGRAGMRIAVVVVLGVAASMILPATAVYVSPFLVAPVLAAPAVLMFLPASNQWAAARNRLRLALLAAQRSPSNPYAHPM